MYNNHARLGSKNMFRDSYIVTDAPVHDPQALDGLLTQKGLP